MINLFKKRAEPLHRCFTCLEPHTAASMRKVVYEVEVCDNCAHTTSGSADDIAEEIREASALPRVGPEVPDPEDLDRDTNVRFPIRWWNRFGADHGILRPVCSPEESCLVQDDSSGTSGGTQLRFDGCGA